MADYIPDPADIGLVAEAVAETRTDCDPHLPCAACRASACAVLSALAGRLLPTGGRTEWGWLSADGSRVYASTSEQSARRAASRSGARRLMRRTLGPWQPAPAGGRRVDLPAPIDGGTDDTR